MTKGPKISIITACYNAEKTIEQTIQSVLSQTYDNIEYIIVDGASTDRTMEIVEKYKDQIDVIISEPDEGIYDAFNKGARAATGDYIQYLNADDYLIDDRVVSDIILFINKHSDAAIVYGGILCKNEKTGYMSLINKEFKYEEFQTGKVIPHQATFVRKSEIIENGLFDVSYEIAGDYDLIAKIFKKYKENVYYLPRLVSVFRLGGISGQLTNNALIEKEIGMVLSNNFNIQNYNERVISNEKYLMIWLEKKNFEHKNITDFLKQQNITNIVIWGTGKISNLLIPELKENNIQIKAFIDNNSQKKGYRMHDVLIQNPNWLVEYQHEIDGIVFGFEGRYEEEVKKQLKILDISIKTYSWRELLEK